jgi:acyl-CoA synthetase (NDP forming)
VVFYKSGQTNAGMRAALSHVGAIAGSDTNKIYQGFINQTKILGVQNIDELVDLAMALSLAPLPNGNRIGVFTYGGSLGVMMSDAAEKNGLKVDKLTDSQIEKLNKMLPPYWSHNNPVDVTDGNSVYQPRNLLKVLKIIIENYDGLFIVAPVFDNEKIFDVSKEERNFRKMYQEIVKTNIKKYRKITEETNKPIFILGDRGEFSKIFVKNGIPVYPDFDSIAKAYAGLYHYSKIIKEKND